MSIRDDIEQIVKDIRYIRRMKEEIEEMEWELAHQGPEKQKEVFPKTYHDDSWAKPVSEQFKTEYVKDWNGEMVEVTKNS